MIEGELFVMTFPAKEDSMTSPGVRTVKSWFLFRQVGIIKKHMFE